MPKNIKARLQNKHDIEANWLNATNFVPLAGEIIIYDPDTAHELPRVKIGDGKTLVNSLAFVDADLTEHIADATAHKTYAAGEGISLAGTTINNAGVRSIATGTTNGTISVNTNGTPTDVAVKGLGSAAYSNVDAYDSAGTASTLIAEHNLKTDSHNDLRILVNELSERIAAVANSDDETLDQLSEIVAYIKNNKELIENVTNTKINVSDIVNNLTTNVTNKPLSAAQGVALNSLITELKNAVDNMITCGAADPSTATAGKFYFKYTTD